MISPRRLSVVVGGTLAICLLTTYVVGRALGVQGDLRTLIGVGTAICGASAIAAASPVIRARSEQIAYAVSTIFVFTSSVSSMLSTSRIRWATIPPHSSALPNPERQPLR